MRCLKFVCGLLLCSCALSAVHAQDAAENQIDPAEAEETAVPSPDATDPASEPDTDLLIETEKKSAPNKTENPPATSRTAPPPRLMAPPVVRTVPAPAPPRPRMIDAAPPPAPVKISDRKGSRWNKFDVVLSKDGKTLHVIGAIQSGITVKLKRAIEGNPKVKTVALSSTGGLLVEGLAMAELIRDKKLNTYAEYLCASACTFAFLAGEQRIVAPDARIGFHQASTTFSLFLPKSEPDLDSVGNQVMRNTYAAANLDPVIIENTMKTPPNELWFPENTLLLQSRVATRIAAPGEFSVNSGALQSAKDMNQRLSKDQVMKAAALSQPYIYRQAAASIWINAGLGDNLDDLLDGSRAPLFQTFLGHSTPLTDDMIDRFIMLEKEIWDDESYLDSGNCESGYGSWRFPLGTPKKAELKARQDALLTEMIAAASKRPDTAKTAQDSANAQLHFFWAKMMAKHGYNTINVARNFCREPYNYYGVLAAMPRDERIKTFRNLTIASSATTSKLE